MFCWGNQGTDCHLGTDHSMGIANLAKGLRCLGTERFLVETENSWKQDCWLLFCTSRSQLKDREKLRKGTTCSCWMRVSCSMDVWLLIHLSGVVISASMVAKDQSCEDKGHRGPREAFHFPTRDWERSEKPRHLKVQTAKASSPMGFPYLTWQWSRVVTPYKKTNNPMKAAGKSMPVYQPSQAKYSPIFSPKYRLFGTQKPWNHSDVWSSGL